MKLNHILYPAMFGCLFSLYSCVEDKGSYDHLPVHFYVIGIEFTPKQEPTNLKNN